MSRGLLDDSDWEKIYQETPDLSNLGDLVLHLSPDFIPIHFPPKSDMQEVPAIFHDIFYTLEYAVYALREAFAHQIWYLEKKEPPDKMPAAIFGRYYADDVALRLYAAGEQYLVDAIKKMLEISGKQLKPYKEEKRENTRKREKTQEKYPN